MVFTTNATEKFLVLALMVSLSISYRLYPAGAELLPSMSRTKNVLFALLIASPSSPSPNQQRHNKQRRHGFAVSSSSLYSSATTTYQPCCFPVYFDSSNRFHRDLQYHPEQPERITACVNALLKEFRDDETSSYDDATTTTRNRRRTIDLVDVAPDDDDDVCGGGGGGNDDAEQAKMIRREPFSEIELNHARSMLLKVHDEKLVTNLEQRCRSSKQKRVEQGKDPLGHMGYIDFDTCT